MKPFRERNPITVGLISVAVLTVAMFFAFSLNRLTFLRGVTVVEADFADAAGLTPENEVRVAGLKVGKVRSIELSSPNGTASQTFFDRVRVSMEISRGLKLGNMSEAEIKLKTILGSKFVDIVPRGGEPFIEAGQRIPLERTRIPFELYEVTNRTVGTVGELDAKALNDSLRELADLTEDPDGNLGRALRGLSKASEGLVDRDAELQELLRSGAVILEVLGSRSESLGRIFDSGAELLSQLASRRDALNRFVRGSDRLGAELSDLIAKTRSDLDPALRDLHEVLEVVRKDLGPVEKAVEALGPSARSFGRAFTQGRWGDVWIQSILDIPNPPILPAGTGIIPADTTAASNERSSDDPLLALMLGTAS
ncbi:MAG: MCE family protein [Actinomycetota bacterium]